MPAAVAALLGALYSPAVSIMPIPRLRLPLHPHLLPAKLAVADAALRALIGPPLHRLDDRS